MFILFTGIWIPVLQLSPPLLHGVYPTGGQLWQFLPSICLLKQTSQGGVSRPNATKIRWLIIVKVVWEFLFLSVFLWPNILFLGTGNTHILQILYKKDLEKNSTLKGAQVGPVTQVPYGAASLLVS